MKKSLIVLLLVAVAAVASFAVTQNTSFFKGSLTSIPAPGAGFDSNVSLALEVANCAPENCLNPSIVTHTSNDLRDVEFLIKGVFSNEVVYAEYLPYMEAGNRYEIAFESDLCGAYKFDGVTLKYMLVDSEPCTEKTFDFMVSGISNDTDLPFATEYTSFTLSE